MIVNVNGPLSLQLTETARYLAEFRTVEGSARNDRNHFRPTLEALDRLTIAVHAARVPLTSFLEKDPQPMARFEASNGHPVSENLDRAVTYLRDDSHATVSPNALSLYEGPKTNEALGLVRKLYHAILSGIQKSAEQDLHQLRTDNIEQFLTASELLARWAAASETGSDA